MVGSGGRATPERGDSAGGLRGCGNGTPCRSNTTGKVMLTGFDSRLRPSVNSKPR